MHLTSLSRDATVRPTGGVLSCAAVWALPQARRCLPGPRAAARRL
jgi:hypothetical protein